MNILIIAPHPDDDILGCGGSIAKHVHAGNSVSIVYVTSGESGDASVPKEDLQKLREDEARVGAGVLGVTDIEFLHMRDGFVEYSLENITKIGQLFRIKKPDVLYVPHTQDGHVDHRATHALVITALHRSSAHAFQEIKGESWNIGTVLGYEVWTPLSDVTYVEDVSAHMALKLQAMQKHVSQLKNKAYDKAIEGFNAYRAAMTGAGTFAECFTVYKASSVGLWK